MHGHRIPNFYKYWAVGGTDDNGHMVSVTYGAGDLTECGGATFHVTTTDLV